MISVIVADDHPLTLTGTAQFVRDLGYTVKATCSNGTAALNAIYLHEPTLALLDINMPGLDGFDVLKTLSEKKLKTKIIVITMHNDYAVYLKARELGALGYVLKEEATSELKPCIDAVLTNSPWASTKLINRLTKSENNLTSELSLIESRIVELIGAQKSTKLIGELLFIAEKTVEKHRSRIIEKLGLPKEKNALLKWAMQNKEIAEKLK